MTIFVFLGARLPEDKARAILDAVYLPAARRGDVLRVARQNPAAIGILDGCLDSPVPHKEILVALSTGIPVFGGSGTGAIHAAELERFGMIGIGEVFQSVKTGRISDDELTVHSTAPSEESAGDITPLVDMEDTFRAAVLAGIITAHHAEQMLTLTKQLHFTERTYPAIFELAQRAGIVATTCRELRTFAAARSPLTLRDAVAVLKHIKEFSATLPRQRPPSFVLERTVFMDRLDSQIEQLGADPCLIFPLGGTQSPERGAHLDQLTRGGETLKVVRKKVLLRLLAARELNRLGITVSPQDALAMSNDFRRQFGLTSSAEVHAWLASEELSPEDFTEVMYDFAAVRIAERLYSGEIDRRVPNHIRINAVRYWSARRSADSNAPATPDPGSGA